MESIKEDEDVLYTKCKHKFHATCVFQNTTTNGYKCPNCRGSLLPTKANVMTTKETHLDVSGNNIISIIEIMAIVVMYVFYILIIMAKIIL